MKYSGFQGCNNIDSDKHCFVIMTVQVCNIDAVAALHSGLWTTEQQDNDMYDSVVFAIHVLTN